MNPAATAPSGSNAFIASDDTGKKKQTYSKESSIMLTAEDIGQIVEALKPVVYAIVEETNAAGKSNLESGPVDGASPLDAPAADIPLDAPAADMPPADDAAADMKPITDEGQEDMDLDADDVVADEKPDEEKAKYQKEASEYRVKYGKLLAENRDLKATYAKAQEKLAKLEVAEETAYRYAKLTEADREGYVIPGGVEAELDYCQQMKFSREQFDKHCERVRASYQKVHRGGIYIPEEKPATTIGSAAGDDMEKRAKYAKEAMSRVESARAQGKSLDYGDALATIRKEAEQAAA
jgi:hypothetical protein